MGRAMRTEATVRAGRTQLGGHPLEKLTAAQATAHYEVMTGTTLVNLVALHGLPGSAAGRADRNRVLADLCEELAVLAAIANLPDAQQHDALVAVYNDLAPLLRTAAAIQPARAPRRKAVYWTHEHLAAAAMLRTNPVPWHAGPRLALGYRLFFEHLRVAGASAIGALALLENLAAARRTRTRASSAAKASKRAR